MDNMITNNVLEELDGAMEALKGNCPRLAKAFTLDLFGDIQRLSFDNYIAALELLRDEAKRVGYYWSTHLHVFITCDEEV